MLHIMIKVCANIMGIGEKRMSSTYSFFQNLSDSEITEIKDHAILTQYRKNELIFSEGDTFDSFYIIESGKVSIYVEKCGVDEPVNVLGKNEYFGEMAIFNNNRRTASAMAYDDIELLRVDKDYFLSFIRSHPQVFNKINRVLIKRNEELLVRESLIGITGMSANKLHVSIKGDPSLRESAFYRERYESVVDRLLPELQPVLENLLLNCCVYRVFINFNSGEIRTSSVFKPFYEEIHTANKLLDKAYIERHFQKISYKQKSDFIRRMFSFISVDTLYKRFPPYMKNIYNQFHKNWQPIQPEEISRVMSRLSTLRGIQSFYLRNFSLSIIQDSIRLQFNCDGTHFISSKDYQQFLEENLSK